MRKIDVMNDSEHNPGDVTKTILSDELQIIAEIERLEQQNAEFNSIDGIDDLFIHYGRSDNQLLDEMVAEFGLECPDFDIFNYVDPALDAELDADEALSAIHCDIPALDPALDVDEAISAINCDIRPADIDLKSLAESCVQEYSEQVVMMKRQLKHQHEMVSQLQQHLNILIETHRANSETLLEKVDPFQHQTPVETEPNAHVSARMLIGIPDIGNATTNEQSPLNDCGQVTEVPEIENVQPCSEECHERSVFITRSKDGVEQQAPPLHAENNFNRFEDSLRLEKIRITWNGSDDEKQFTCQLIGSEASDKAARDIRKMMKWFTSPREYLTKN